MPGAPAGSPFPPFSSSQGAKVAGVKGSRDAGEWGAPDQSQSSDFGSLPLVAIGERMITQKKVADRDDLAYQMTLTAGAHL